MIFLVDRSDWDAIVKSKKEGILIIDRHLLEEHYEWHRIKDMGAKRFLGKVEIYDLIMTRIADIDNKQVLATNFPSRNALKRILLPFAPKWKKDVDAITVTKFRVIETENYWCSGCDSVNLEYLKKPIYADQLPFRCFDCKLEFYTQDLEEGSPRVKNAKLEARYCEKRINKIPVGHEGVVAAVGGQ